MKTYIELVVKLTHAGMERTKAIKTVAQGYCLTQLEIIRLDDLTNLKGKPLSYTATKLAN